MAVSPEAGSSVPAAAESLKRKADDIDQLDFAPPTNGVVEIGAADVVQQGNGAEESDDDDFGPMPLPAGAEGAPTKKRKVLKHERLYLDRLPSADRYYKSFMHRDHLSQIAVTKTNFVLTASQDGILKFWKKQAVGVEFVKLYRTHLAPIVHVGVSDDGKSAAVLGADTGGKTAGGNEVKGSAKVFDVENFDMINILKLPYNPRTSCWLHGVHDARTLLAITDYDSAAIRIYDGRGDGTPLHTIETLHRQSVHLMTFNSKYNTVISVDIGGMIEYWEPSEPFEKPENVEWQNKGSTGLYEFKKTKSTPVALSLSPTQDSFALLSLPSLRVTIFSFLTGRLIRAYDESLEAVQEMQQAGTLPAGVEIDSMEFGRRLAIERDVERLALEGIVEGRTTGATVGTIAWDEGGKFVIYPTLLGIKVVNTVTNKVSRMIGKDETVRFLNVSLYQGLPVKKGVQTIAMATSENPLLQDKNERDPTLFCTAYKRNRFYMFTRSDPEDKEGERDVYNEKPTRDEMSIAAPAIAQSGPLGRRAIIHTTKGDVFVDLFPDLTPKTVENFVGLSRKNYYDDVIFHRVIPKFMLQTGDPLGDGTGGESLWGSTFEDEIVPSLRHDRPYTLSMANAGPKTNGSQFFITTVPCPWLDGKHTVFGRATSGFETIHDIENARTDKGDKPFDDIKIVSIDIES